MWAWRSSCPGVATLSAPKAWERWGWLAAQGGLIAAAFGLWLPSEGGGFLGLSLARWGLLGLLLGLSVVCAGLAVALKRGRPGAQRLAQAFSQPQALNLILGFSLVLGLVCIYLLLLTAKFTDAFVSARLVRLLPLTVWLVWLAVLSLVWLPRLRPKDGERASEKAAWKPTLWAGLVLLSLAVWMVYTGLGLQPDRTGWDTPGTPLLNTQVTLGWLIALVVAGAVGWANRKFGWRFTRLDALLAVLIWALAAWFWIVQPVLPTYFSVAPTAPNFEFYPNSDAATMDVAAQHLLIGAGLPDVIEKPLYAAFLALLHVVAGQSYASVVNAQILVLALFPALLYLLAKRVHTRFAGLLLAVVVSLREANSLALSGEILVSHSKLLMTDLPAALALAAFTLLLLHWLNKQARNPVWALWVGAALGLMLLLRSQMLIFLPFLALLAFWQAGGGWRPRLQLAAVLLAGFALAALPWLLRNAQRTGQFGYSQPLQMLYMAKQYSLTPELADPGFPPDTPVEDYVRLGSANVRAFVLAHPGEVTRFITAHTLRNEVSSVLALPMRFDLSDRLVTFYNLQPYWQGLEDRLWNECCSLDSYIAETPYWGAWLGDLPSEAWLPLVFNLTVIAVGIGAAWRKLGWLALVPLGLHLLYSVSTALARVSGWRLILPADWVVILFYCVGLTQLTLWLGGFLFGVTPRAEVEPVVEGGKAVPSRQALLAAAALALLAGAAIPLVEMAVPSRYADLDRAAALQRLQAAGLDGETFLRQPDARLYWGRGLYPSHYPAGGGLPSNEADAFSPQPFARLAFRLVGPQVYDQVALPAAVAPAFPHASDVLVLGCAGQGYLRAAAVLFLNEPEAALIAEGPAPFVCD